MNVSSAPFFPLLAYCFILFFQLIIVLCSLLPRSYVDICEFGIKKTRTQLKLPFSIETRLNPSPNEVRFFFPFIFFCVCGDGCDYWCLLVLILAILMIIFAIGDCGLVGFIVALSAYCCGLVGNFGDYFWPCRLYFGLVGLLLLLDCGLVGFVDEYY